MKKLVSIVVALAFAGGLLGVAPSVASAEVPAGASISGHVDAQPGDPIYLGQLQGSYRDADGNYLGAFGANLDANNDFVATGLAPGIYTLYYYAAYPNSPYLTKQYYKQSAAHPAGETITLTADEQLTGIDFTLHKPGDVNGIVFCNSCQAADKLAGTLQAYDETSAVWVSLGDPVALSSPIILPNTARYFSYDFGG